MSCNVLCWLPESVAYPATFSPSNLTPVPSLAAIVGDGLGAVGPEGDDYAGPGEKR